MASGHVRNIGPMQAAPRCQRIKRNGERCRAPAVTGRRLCRCHGGKAGAPMGNRNGLKHGLYTGKALERDRKARALLRQIREVLKALEEERTG